MLRKMYSQQKQNKKLETQKYEKGN